jgi:hypothetical protein
LDVRVRALRSRCLCRPSSSDPSDISFITQDHVSIITLSTSSAIHETFSLKYCSFWPFHLQIFSALDCARKKSSKSHTNSNNLSHDSQDFDHFHSIHFDRTQQSSIIILSPIHFTNSIQTFSPIPPFPRSLLLLHLQISSLFHFPSSSPLTSFKFRILPYLIRSFRPSQMINSMKLNLINFVTVQERFEWPDHDIHKTPNGFLERRYPHKQRKLRCSLNLAASAKKI